MDHTEGGTLHPQAHLCLPRRSCQLGTSYVPTLLITFTSTYPTFLRLFTFTLTPEGQAPIQANLLLGCSDHVVVTR